MKTCPPCSNPKTHYWDREHAQTALDLIKADPDPWRAYNPCRVIPCDWCDHWVLTSKRQARPQALNTRKPAQRNRRSWSGSRNVGKENRKR